MAVKFPFAVVLEAADHLSAPLAKIQGNVSRLGQSLTSYGKKASLALTTPILGLFSASIAVAEHAEQAGERFRAASGLGAQGLKELRGEAEKIKGLFSEPEKLAGLTSLVQGGFTASESLRMLRGTMDLARATESELTDSSKAVTLVLQAWRKPVGEAASVADLLAVASNRSGLALGELAGELAEAGQLGTEAGQSLAGTTALIVKFHQAGIGGGAALRKALIALADPSSKAAGALTRLGIRRPDLVTTEGKLRDMSEVLLLLRERGATAGDVLEIFGRRSGAAIVQAMGRGAGGISELTRELTRQGSAAEIAEVMNEGLSGQLRQLRIEGQAALQAIGESGLIAAATSLVKALAPVFTWISKLSPKFLKWGVIVLGVVAAIGPLLLFVGQAVTLFTALWPAIVAGVGALGAVAAVIGGPWLLAIGGAVVAVTLLWKYWDDIVGAIRDAGAAIWRWIKPAFDWINRAIDALPNWFTELFGGGGSISVATPGEGPPMPGKEWSPSRFAGELASRVGAVDAPGSATVKVRFEGAPRGMRAETERAKGVKVDLATGYSLAGTY